MKIVLDRRSFLNVLVRTGTALGVMPANLVDGFGTLVSPSSTPKPEMAVLARLLSKNWELSITTAYMSSLFEVADAVCAKYDFGMPHSKAIFEFETARLLHDILEKGTFYSPSVEDIELLSQYCAHEKYPGLAHTKEQLAKAPAYYFERHTRECLPPLEKLPTNEASKQCESTLHWYCGSQFGVEPTSEQRRAWQGLYQKRASLFEVLNDLLDYPELKDRFGDGFRPKEDRQRFLISSLENTFRDIRKHGALLRQIGRLSSSPQAYPDSCAWRYLSVFGNQSGAQELLADPKFCLRAKVANSAEIFGEYLEKRIEPDEIEVSKLEGSLEQIKAHGIELPPEYSDVISTFSQMYPERQSQIKSGNDPALDICKLLELDKHGTSTRWQQGAQSITAKIWKKQQGCLPLAQLSFSEDKSFCLMVSRKNKR